MPHVLIEDGMIPNLNDRIIHNIVADAPSIFANESAGIEQHPALELYADGSGDVPDDPRIFLESCGIFDANNTDIPARSVLGSALRNLNPKLKGTMPDIALHRGSRPYQTMKIQICFQGCFLLCSLMELQVSMILSVLYRSRSGHKLNIFWMFVTLLFVVTALSLLSC